MIIISLFIVIVPGQSAADVVQDEQPPVPRDPGLIYMTCDRCTWENGYETMAAAKMGAASHRRWCRDGHGRKKNLFGG